MTERGLAYRSTAALTVTAARLLELRKAACKETKHHPVEAAPVPGVQSLPLSLSFQASRRLLQRLNSMFIPAKHVYNQDNFALLMKTCRRRAWKHIKAQLLTKANAAHRVDEDESAFLFLHTCADANVQTFSAFQPSSIFIKPGAQNVSTRQTEQRWRSYDFHQNEADVSRLRLGLTPQPSHISGALTLALLGMFQKCSSGGVSGH